LWACEIEIASGRSKHQPDTVLIKIIKKTSNAPAFAVQPGKIISHYCRYIRVT
jgi:hypothetical protein